MQNMQVNTIKTKEVLEVSGAAGARNGDWIEDMHVC